MNTVKTIAVMLEMLLIAVTFQEVAGVKVSGPWWGVVGLQVIWMLSGLAIHLAQRPK